jgi:hypothetical protein
LSWRAQPAPPVAHRAGNLSFASTRLPVASILAISCCKVHRARHGEERHIVFQPMVLLDCLDSVVQVFAHFGCDPHHAALCALLPFNFAKLPDFATTATYSA